MKLNNEEMSKVMGGAISFKIAAIIGGIIVFAVGLIDGIINPKKCN